MEGSELSDASTYYQMLSLSSNDDSFYIESQDINDSDRNLLVPISPSNFLCEYTCANSKIRAGMWLTAPRFRDESFTGPGKPNLGVLSLLSILFIKSEISECANTRCTKYRDDMEKKAPHCNWKPFRQWALVAMSCQHAFRGEDRVSVAGAHVAHAVQGCIRIIREARHSPELFHEYLDHFPGQSVNLFEVFEVLHWMATIQCSLGVAMDMEKWDHDFLPSTVTSEIVSEAFKRSQDLRICKARFSGFMRLAERTHSDLPAVVEALSCAPSLSHDYDEKHLQCNESTCQLACMDTTYVAQLHRCTSQVHCPSRVFDPDLLIPAIESGQKTAWHQGLTRLARPEESYIAISHVWSDGTGVGVQGRGLVNECLWQYFTDLLSTTGFGCVAIWWDAISIPLDNTARRKAINEMHNNYYQASCTVVHDSYLLQIDAGDAETACHAIVLSPWFSRGWTALELAMSREVRLLFKGADVNSPAIVNLDDILAASPAVSTRAHWISSCMIRRLRKSGEPTHLMTDLLTILQPRVTARTRDRPVIAGLLGNVAMDYRDDEQQTTRKVITHLGSVPYISLLHGKPTMFDEGPFSWCPRSLDDMPIDMGTDMNGDLSHPEGSRMLGVVGSGALDGIWLTRPLSKRDIAGRNIRPYGNDVGTAMKIERALTKWESCLLLKGEPNEEEPLLLAITFGLEEGEDSFPIIDCRYVGAVISSLAHDGNPGIEDETMPSWFAYKVRIGSVGGSNGQDVNAYDIIEAADDMDSRYEAPLEVATNLKSIMRLKETSKEPGVQPGLIADPSNIPVMSAHLIQAMDEFNGGATRHLIRMGAQFSTNQERELHGRVHHKLKRLGDAYCQVGQDSRGKELHKRATVLLFQEEDLSKLITDTMKDWTAMFLARGRRDWAVKLHQRVRDECREEVQGHVFKKRYAIRRLEELKFDESQDRSDT